MRISQTLSTLLFCGICASAIAQPADCLQGIEELKFDRFESSIEPLSSCLKQELPIPARAFILNARAHAYGQLKLWSAAVDDQRRSISAVEPTAVWPYVMLGVYLRENNQLEDSLEALKAALKFDEDGPGTGPGMAVYYHTAKTLHKAGRYKEAIESVTKGIPKQPDYGSALYQRALSYEALGDKGQAKRDLFRAFELTPKEGYEVAIAEKLREYGFIAKVHAR
jgi:tetratricopeptide (TPR) repeat protein